jgi:hypothetical protein
MSELISIDPPGARQRRVRVHQSRVSGQGMTNLTALFDSAHDYFASSYAEARKLFREACVTQGAALIEHAHPLKGPRGEALAIDVALLGPANASNLLIVISGTHGVEGFAGSGCQVGWLRLHRRSDLPPDSAVLFVHMLNPWGCAWARRQTEDNVDLNRNFCDFNQNLPDNPLYEAIHDIIVNPLPVVRAVDDGALKAFRAENGDQKLAIGLFSGQYRHNDGVGYGGSQATWSNLALRSIVAKHAMAAKRTVVLDVHTGLGPFGHGTLLSVEAAGSVGLDRARAYFGPGVSAVSDDASVPYEIYGNLLAWITAELPGDVTSIAIEFGTLPLARLLELQVDDCRRRNFHDAWSALSPVIRRDLIGFFFPATMDWMQSTILRSSQMIHLALRGMQNDASRPLAAWSGA